MAVAELTLVPIGTENTSVSEYVACAVKVLEREKVQYQLTPMGTIISCKDLKKLYEIVATMQEELFAKGLKRLYSVIKIDDRRDKDYSYTDKVISVEKKLKEEN